MGYKGDPCFKSKVVRPTFTKDGSFMVFRKLEQAVLALEDYVNANYTSIPVDEPTDGSTLSDKERRDLFGARLVGRFKSVLHHRILIMSIFSQIYFSRVPLWQKHHTVTKPTMWTQNGSMTLTTRPATPRTDLPIVPSLRIFVRHPLVISIP